MTANSVFARLNYSFDDAKYGDSIYLTEKTKKYLSLTPQELGNKMILLMVLFQEVGTTRIQHLAYVQHYWQMLHQFIHQLIVTQQTHLHKSVQAMLQWT